jgi:hypothetical protein
MTELEIQNHRKGEQRRVKIAALLLATWLVAIAILWTGFIMAPTGVLATADAGKLLAIQGSMVTTTHGFFRVSTTPSAALGTSLRVIHTNSLWSGTGLQLCALRSTGGDYWCSDISDGYAGELSETALGRRAWSHGMMGALLSIAVILTILGCFAVVGVATSGDGSSDIIEGASNS